MLTTIAISALILSTAVAGVGWAFSRTERDVTQGELEEVAKSLASLRANCFVTNEKGHRVRWTNATSAARAKAEGSDL